MASPVTDPALLQQLNAPTAAPGGAPGAVTDPALLQQLSAPQQAQQPQQPPAQPYTWGPLSDIAELGARGINAAVQSIAPMFGAEIPPRQPQPLGTPVNVPILGKPSAVEMVKAVPQQAYDVATLPRDVYTGAVDPLSDEGIRRGLNFGASVVPGGMPSVAQRAATAPLTTEQILARAGSHKNLVQDYLRSTPTSQAELDAMIGRVRQDISATGPAAGLDAAKPVYAKLDALERRAGGDLGDLFNVRSNIKDAVRDGTISGQGQNAAKRAVQAIDREIEQFHPELVPYINAIDKSFAIGYGAARNEAAVSAAQAGARRGGQTAGQRISNIFGRQLERGGEERIGNFSQAQLEATQRAAEPGVLGSALSAVSVVDPTRRSGALWHGLAAVPTFWGTGGLGSVGQAGLGAVGFGARKAYDRLMANRAAEVSNVMRSEAPVTQWQPGYQAGGAVAAPPTVAGNLMAPTHAIPFGLSPRSEPYWRRGRGWLSIEPPPQGQYGF